MKPKMPEVSLHLLMPVKSRFSRSELMKKILLRISAIARKIEIPASAKTLAANGSKGAGGPLTRTNVRNIVGVSAQYIRITAI